MSSSYKTQVEQREKDGPFYEDFKVGEVLRHSGGRTITDTDNIWFTLLTCNTNQIHYNKEYTEKYFANSPFDGRLVVNSLLVLSTVLGLSVNDTSKNGIMLGMREWKVTNPTFAGDTVHAESVVIAKRESKSHPSMGIVTVKTKGFKQKDTEVMEFERSFMVRKTNAEWK
ncbi:MAG: MaoC family dehydratase [archaeon]|nr:MaoC family dehydratase [archaeon]